MDSCPRTTKPAPEATSNTTQPPRRKRCDNCFALMKPGKKWKRFCTPEDPGKGKCKDEFHRNGGAFGPMKTRLEKLVKQMTRDTFNGLRAEIAALEKRIAALELQDPEFIRRANL